MKWLWLGVVVYGLMACSPSDNGQAADGQAESGVAAVAPGKPMQATADEIAAEVERANQFFERTFMDGVMRSPTFQAYLGIKKDQDKWNDISDENAKRELEITRRELKELRETIDFNKLDEPTKLSYRLYVERAEQDIENFQYRLHNYPINQMYGAQSRLPSFLINIHRIDNETDARGYIARLNGIDEQITQVIENLKLRESKGIVAPKFVFPYAISDTKNVLSGKPFVSDALEDSALLADFKKKVANIEIDTQLREELITEASGALAESVKPAFGSLIEFLMEQEKRANTDDGAWKLPDGEAFYAMALKRTTTTDMTADEIHELGLSEVARIHEEMRAIMEQVEFDGTLQEFFEFMRTDKQFYYDETPEGRAAYLAKAEDIIDTMRGRLDELFVTKPKADLVVKAVEAFREKSAGKAFYQRPAPDGSRPGTYYANLYKMSDMPTYQMEALAYHEGIPGHHMQLAIAQELKDVPSFRKYGRYTAYTEGWGLYSELVPKEMGFYSDPYSDFGRLAMEIWRACRLVVDTGIHHKKWTREQAIDYLSTNTPNPYGDVVKAIERYIVMPSQATAYKIGMIKIVELRDKARAALGDDFDVREFHEVVLRSGPVPLSVLEDQVADYVARKSQERA